MPSIQVLTLALLGLAASAHALCKPAVGIRAMTNNNCHPVFCTPQGNCSYQPCHFITIYHNDGSSTGGFEIGGPVQFSEGKRDQIYEWGFFGSKDAKGMSVYANGCGGSGGNGGLGGMGCDGNAVKRTNRSLPGVSRVYYDCGKVPAVPK
ncbi:hypothetical protein BX616_011068 [Lobosporangium transversale]|uniref:Uncharacterized protein n=1 Tax=Lobosporangium transversale TaxID=64571 RepID=A0A1Y2GHE9_9FUNG|nr:hypothetical protein BCR41DRAFT_360180 [Lobosporangium transversale]XP_021881960.1 hypothetical protein BCR41DRAFT_352748 [Lobosporangium transversale]KAF9909734.1 hypothetical protein BX616_011068 [Lobosporangium transversale]ORZ07553.1 hypothetical protein BCR41DRAFT_360180 [Lobosporangium transversale]ORZ17573.1 hypothetical protein BCR41DRAFT_352748 [Lobosporangium transversale]|eukprot:XP_021878060.1 hypothetical protein BCR41DRAFT_360180 [Lobosporangium transversale]